MIPPTLIGHTHAREPIEHTEQDLKTHAHGIGASRFGKSKWLEWFARVASDRRGRRGRIVAVAFAPGLVAVEEQHDATHFALLKQLKLSV